MDPVVTLHSPEKLDATEVQPAPQPFRAAAAETQLDVHPRRTPQPTPPLDHMAAWNTMPAAPEIEAATAPYQPEEPAQPEQLGFDVPQEEEPLRYVGEVFRTYILAERGDELCLIDKHAAHERQLYEKLAANYGNVPSQLLLAARRHRPFRKRKSRRCWKTSPCWKTPGWTWPTLAAVRCCCARACGRRAAKRRGPIGRDRRPLAQGQPGRAERAHRMGAALHLLPRRHQGGDKSSPQELMALAEKILSGEVPPFCPHGRPCVLKLTRKELEKQFGRIV